MSLVAEGIQPDLIKPVDTGTISVKVFQDLEDQGKWRFRVSVFGSPCPKSGMRAGLTATLAPETCSSERELRDKFGRMAAATATALGKLESIKGNRACIDEVDAYHGAVELLEQNLLELKAKGKI